MGDIKIIYEDNDVLVINKPAGLLVHKALVLGEPTLVDWLLKKYPGVKNVGDDPKTRPGIVHRLDKDTSGVMIVAKNQTAFEYLKNQFQNHKIKKTYLALVSGKLKDKKGMIDLPIGRSKSPLKRLASGRARGKLREAITGYKVLQFFDIGCQKSPTSDVGDGKFSLVEVYPKTGRTHQIRVHFKAIGHPVVCDRLYGRKNEICPSGLNRQFLHALSLELTFLDESRNKFEAGLPEDLENVLRILKKSRKYDINNK